MTRTFHAVALAAMLACPAAAQAQPADDTNLASTSPIWVAATSTTAPATPIASAARREAAELALTEQGADAPIRRPPQQRSLTRKILGGVAGGVGGFFLGGYLGAQIEGDSCNCDDPGLKGIIIGAPIGAIGGAIFGTLVL
jgi:hypothetical protein